jgi:DNA-binding winged helix-turn-helix (wHTH) protein
VTFHFDPFLLDPETRRLLKGGEPIHLEPKAFDLLSCLIEARPRVLSKDVLQERLWPDTFVAEANLSNLIAELRRSLGDDARRPIFIRTVHGVGYAFSGDATTVTPGPPTKSGAPLCWLEWGTRRFPLSAGEHIVGRDPSVAISLDSSTVSRRHARILVTADAAHLEDLDSKNGTFRGTEPVRGRVQLEDGDDLRVGSVALTYHVSAVDVSTATLDRGTHDTPCP